MSSPKLTVMIRETNWNYKKFLTPVRIPVDRNLIGYRILLIEKDEQPQLAKVIRELNLKNRTLISIPNPDLQITVPFDRKELWYNPLE